MPWASIMTLIQLVNSRCLARQLVRVGHAAGCSIGKSSAWSSRASRQPLTRKQGIIATGGRYQYPRPVFSASAPFDSRVLTGRGSTDWIRSFKAVTKAHPTPKLGSQYRSFSDIDRAAGKRRRGSLCSSKFIRWRNCRVALFRSCYRRSETPLAWCRRCPYESEPETSSDRRVALHQDLVLTLLHANVLQFVDQASCHCQSRYLTHSGGPPCDLEH